MALKTVATPTIGNRSIDHLISAESIRISPINLGDGGRPRLAAHISSHQMVLSGRISLNPRVMASVRVLFRSYIVLARQKRADETSPCAIINIRAPFSPQVVWENMPAATILM